MFLNRNQSPYHSLNANTDLFTFLFPLNTVEPIVIEFVYIRIEIGLLYK